MTNVLLLHPGAMGASLGDNLIRNKHSVYWISGGRSQATYQRARQVGLTPLDQLEEGTSKAEMVISVCPPEFAVSVAESVCELGYQGLYCDANAIAPATAHEIHRIFDEHYVDGGIIGPPAHTKGHTRMYLSGERANEVSALFVESNLDTVVLKQGTLSASATKMCYAAYTKGSAALVLGIRAMAEHYDVSGVLKQEWNTSIQGLWDRSERMARSTSKKAWRFTHEMREIAQSFDAANLPDGFHQAAAEIYLRMSDLKEVAEVSSTQVLENLLLKSDNR